MPLPVVILAGGLFLWIVRSSVPAGHTFVSCGCGCRADGSPSFSFLPFVYFYSLQDFENISSIVIYLFMFELLGLGRIHPSLSFSSPMISYISRQIAFFLFNVSVFLPSDNCFGIKSEESRSFSPQLSSCSKTIY